VKPVLFAKSWTAPPPDPIPDAPALAAIVARRDTAVILDLPGEESILGGLALARRGLRPVPLFNATDGPRPVVDVSAVGRWLELGAGLLDSARLEPDSPPAFLLDSARNPSSPQLAPGAWDNRSIVLPQDFPSAAFLQSRGVTAVLVVRRGAITPAADLAHVLLAWQKAGLELRALDLASGLGPEVHTVTEPSRFGRAWYRVLALLGLRRSSVGGFGGLIPHPSSGRSGFHG